MWGQALRRVLMQAPRIMALIVVVPFPCREKGGSAASDNKTEKKRG